MSIENHMCNIAEIFSPHLCNVLFSAWLVHFLRNFQQINRLQICNVENASRANRLVSVWVGEEVSLIL